jgi:tetratricopeptide (TPR) repeat protein
MEVIRAMDRNGQGTRPEAAALVRSSVPRVTLVLLRTVAAVFILLTIQPLCLQAQFDMIVFEKRPPQARSREELDAVLDVVQATDQKTIVSLCARFRQKFPASELAGQVYRMEMHAYGRLDDYKKMIEAGEKALEISAHDVDALLSLANAIPNGVNDLTPASVALLDKAEGYARKALEEVDRLKATRGVSLDRWRNLTGRMRSSGREALGFIAFKRGLYSESVAEFEKSIGLNPSAGGAVFFRLGVAYLYCGKPLEAQVALERSCELGPELIRTKAKEQLAIIVKRNTLLK